MKLMFAILSIYYNVQMEKHLVDLQLNDTAGQEDYDRLRPVAYPNTDVFLLCFSLDDAENTRNVKEKWLPELINYCPGVPVVLVGTKSDLRHQAVNPIADVVESTKRRRQITRREGEELANEIGAVGYVECSAKRREGVQEVFALAASAALLHSIVTSSNGKPFCNSRATTFRDSLVSSLPHKVTTHCVDKRRSGRSSTSSSSSSPKKPPKCCIL